MIIISTSLTVPGQPSPRFHVKAWLPYGLFMESITELPNNVIYCKTGVSTGKMTKMPPW